MTCYKAILRPEAEDLVHSVEEYTSDLKGNTALHRCKNQLVQLAVLRVVVPCTLQ
jgi:hypothetical protein